MPNKHLDTPEKLTAAANALILMSELCDEPWDYLLDYLVQACLMDADIADMIHQRIKNS